MFILEIHHLVYFTRLLSLLARRTFVLTEDMGREAKVPRVLFLDCSCCGSSGQADQASMEHSDERGL